MSMDLLLKALCQLPDFDAKEEKNWDGLARLIPGSSAQECQKRYEELWIAHNLQKSIRRASVAASVPSQLFEANGIANKGSRPVSSRSKETKSSKVRSAGSVKNTDAGLPSSDHQGPIMVIHVCDEAKNLKQDFTCPRDLLVREMQYFGEYLSTESQHVEEVDISVHCDVQVFDWLIKYVKRSMRDAPNPPELVPSNAISILISSDFLKMNALVQKCIEFCHANMSAILATPCNMNCIEDRLVTRIADLFSHNELEDVKDRKDKFKSKLFAKKVEKLFDPTFSVPWCPENCSTLYRCSVCKKILTSTLETKVKCLQNRMTIDARGRLSFRHVPDASFDVNDYILDLKTQKSWGDVYWRLWGMVNYLGCMRCGETFPCCELAWCRYHPEAPVYEDSSCGSKRTYGEYPCCGTRVARFDPTLLNKGCRMRDHTIYISSSSLDPAEGHPSASKAKNTNNQQIYDDLLAHRDSVCPPQQKITTELDDTSEVDIFGADEIACGLRGGAMTSDRVDSSSTVSDKKLEPHRKALIIERESTYDNVFEGSDDEVGDDEDGKGTSTKKFRNRRKKIIADPQALLLDGPDINITKTEKWDSTRSLRYNQDSQREEDQRRMKEIVKYLTHLRLGAEKIERLKQRQYAGGMFSKLEAQWKAVNAPLPRLCNPSLRMKPRLNQNTAAK